MRMPHEIQAHQRLLICITLFPAAYPKIHLLLGKSVKMFDCFWSYFLGELVVICLVGRVQIRDSYILF